MNRKQIITNVVTIATLAFATTAAMANEYTYRMDNFQPTRSRAEVKAEVLKARADGVKLFVPEGQNYFEAKSPASMLTREAVRADLHIGTQVHAGELAFMG